VLYRELHEAVEPCRLMASPNGRLRGVPRSGSYRTLTFDGSVAVPDGEQVGGQAAWGAVMLREPRPD
jgi:hypothetical protein